MSFSIEPNPNVPLRIAHADPQFLVVEKPSGVVTQPGKKHEHDSLLNGLFVEYGNTLQNLGEERGWGLLHRLDKDTSGLVIVALRIRAYENLIAQFKERQIKKIYWAVVAGSPRPAQGVIQQPIVEVSGTRKRAVLQRDGKPSITAYKTLQSARGVSLIEARPKTGRLHQIRVHMASIGHPLLGETMYDNKIKPPPANRLCLHAASISFLHPETGHRLTINSPWPSDLNNVLQRYGLKTPVV